MQFIRNFFGGFASMFNITATPLYRYPYYNSAEGLRGDMLRIGKDVEFTLEKLEE
jgi:hypothetical protein